MHCIITTDLLINIIILEIVTNRVEHDETKRNTKRSVEDGEQLSPQSLRGGVSIAWGRVEYCINKRLGWWEI